MDLPEEILCEIMLLNATDTVVELEYRAFTTRSCSQACRSWRETALRCAKLWTHIIDYERDSPAWMEELVNRSSPAPLTISDQLGDPLFWTWRIHRKDLQAHLRENLLLEHRDRWIHLSIFDISQAEALSRIRLIHEFLLQPASHIEALQLGMWDGSSLCLHLEDPLFAGHAPSLRRLDLSEVRVDFDALRIIGGQLENLSLYWNDDNFGNDQQLFSEFIEFLRFTPQLRYLFFHQNITGVEKIIHGQLRFIALDKLRALCLEIPEANVCRAIMDKLTIPDRCGLLLYCKIPHQPPARDQSAIVGMIQQRVQLWRQDVGSSRSLYAHIIRGSQCCSFSNFELPSSPQEIPRTYRNDFTAIMNSDICTEDPPIAFWTGSNSALTFLSDSRFNFLSQLYAFEASFPTTTHLYIVMGGLESLRSNEVSMLLTMFSKMEKLEILEVEPRVYINYLSFLERPTPANSILLPSLQLIRALSQLFAEVQLEIYELQCTERFLRWRLEEGHPISTIDLTGFLEEEATRSNVFRDVSKMVDILH